MTYFYYVHKLGCYKYEPAPIYITDKEVQGVKRGLQGILGPLSKCLSHP